MKSLGALLLAALLAAVLAPSAQAAVNLLSNGSFETGDFTDWTVNGNGFPAVITGPYLGYSGAEDGSYYFFTVLNLPGEPELLSQTFTDTPGQLYNMTFWLAHDGYNALDSFSASLDGTKEVTVGPAGLGWTRFEFTFTGTGSDTVQFALDSFIQSWAFDNATVTAAPEPAGWALMLTGFAGLGAALRSRRKSATA